LKTKFCADDVVVDMPLFHNGCGGSIPTSALQFNFQRINRDTFMPLNELWHSRLPECKNAFDGWFYGAKFDSQWWAVAWWSRPVARAYNGKGFAELRRFAIKDGSPQNTASRMLGWMVRDIKKNMPNVVRLISYQDAEVHKGTIYKASGWFVDGERKNIGVGWKTRPNRKNQSQADKIRWALNLRPPVLIADIQKEKKNFASEECISMQSQTDCFADHV